MSKQPMLTTMAAELSSSQVEPASMAASFGSTSSSCDHIMLSYVEHLGLAIRNLSEAVQSIEARQSSLDERLIVLDGHVQGLMEQHCALVQQQCSLEGLQKVVAGTARKALQTASVVQQQRQEQEFDECLGLLNSQGDSVPMGAWEAGKQRLQQHQRCLEKLSADVKMLLQQVSLLNREVGTDSNVDAGGWNANVFNDAVSQRLSNVQAVRTGATPRAVGPAASSPARRREQLALIDMAGSEVSTATAPGSIAERNLPSLRAENAELRDRLIELERGQKKVLSFAQLALKTTVDLQKEQKEQRQEQDHVNQILSESLQPALAEATQMAEKLEVVEKATDEFRQSCAAEVAGLRTRVHEVHQALMAAIAASVQPGLQDGGQGALADTGAVERSTDSDVVPKGVELSLADLDGLDTRVDRKLTAMRERIQVMLDAAEEQRLTDRQNNWQVPEISRRVDQLWSQCQFYFSKVKAHEVHLSFVRVQKLKALEGSSVASSAPRRSTSRCGSEFGDGDSISSSALLRDIRRYADADDASSVLNDTLEREGVGLPLGFDAALLQNFARSEGSDATHSHGGVGESQHSALPELAPPSPVSGQRCCNDDAASHDSELWGGGPTRRSNADDDNVRHSSELWGGSSVFTGGSHQIVYANGMDQGSNRGARAHTSPKEAHEDGGRWLM